MKKRIKKITLSIVTLLLFLIVMFAAGRWGWKLFGYLTCRMFVGVEEVRVDDESVYIKGTDVNSFPSFYVGYIYDIDGTEMYIGIKYNAFIGVLPEETGDFEITIPTEGKSITDVFLKNSTNIRHIWNDKKGRIIP